MSTKKKTTPKRKTPARTKGSRSKTKRLDRILGDRVQAVAESGRARIRRLEGEAEKLIERVRSIGSASGSKKKAPNKGRGKKLKRLDPVARIGKLLGDGIADGRRRLLGGLGLATAGELSALRRRLDALSARVGKTAKPARTRKAPTKDRSAA